MNKLKIFDNEYYNTFMFVSMLIIIMLIFFNLSNILEQGISKQDMKIENKLTGFAVDDENDEDDVDDVDDENDENDVDDKELYTEKSYLMYYMLLGFLGLCIFILSLIFFLPKLKDIT